MTTKINTYNLHGIDVQRAVVTVKTEKGIGLHLVGLRDNNTKECLLRVTTALMSLGYSLPAEKIMISITDTQGNVLDSGSTAFDLPVALGILISGGKTKAPDVDKYAIAGELGLDGSVRPLRGTYSMALDAGKIILPKLNAIDLCDHPYIEENNLFCAGNLDDALMILQGAPERFMAKYHAEKETRNGANKSDTYQEHLLRGVIIAAAGGHHIACITPSGKIKNASYKIAGLLHDCLSPMTKSEYAEVAKIHDIAGVSDFWGEIRPMASINPQDNFKTVFGGGLNAFDYGRASLAHKGVLHIERYEKMPDSIKHGLRILQDDKKIKISYLQKGVQKNYTLPADCQLVFDLAPCPCGYHSDRTSLCDCEENEIRKHIEKHRDPCIEKCDINLQLENTDPSELRKIPAWNLLRNQVLTARDIQRNRFAPDCGISCNAEIPDRLLDDYCTLSEENSKLLTDMMTNTKLSNVFRPNVIRTARTIADLTGRKNIAIDNLIEAISFQLIFRG